MKRAIPRVVPYGGSETSKFVVEGLRVGGKRVRRFFPTCQKAKAWLRKTTARIAKEGEAAGVLMPEELRVAATTLAAQLKPYGKTLGDAVNHYLKHLATVERSCTVSELAVEFVKAKRANGRRELYLKDLKNRLVRFEEEFGERIVAEVRAKEIEDWLFSLDVGLQSRKNFRTVLSTFFAHAVAREYAADNPVEKIEVASVDRPPPAILAPSLMRALLDGAPLDFIPWLAIGGFAGLRSVEIERLDWSEVHLAERLIRLPAVKSKTRKKRNVRIGDNLAAWLAPLAQKSGPVAAAERIRDARDATIKAVGLEEWPANALRHSFASYHLAHFKNAPATAFELGHASPKMLAEHYDAVAEPAHAAAWWRIVPPADYSNVVAFKREA